MATTVLTSNEETVRRWCETAWNKGELSIADEIYGPGYVLHSGPPSDLRGPERIKSFVADMRQALPDFHVTVEDIISSGDTVVWRFTVTATHKGVLFGEIPPTGKRATVTGIVMSKFSNGLWVEDWAEWDALGMLKQFGVIG